MIAVAVVAVLVLAVVAALWLRVASSRSERRSVEGYGRALDTLGGVAKRTESGAPVQAPTGNELARPHVKAAEGAEPHARPPAQPLTPAPRIRLRPSGPSGTMPVFSDIPGDAGAGAEAQPPASVGDGSPRAPEGDDPTIVLPLEARPAPWAANGRAPDASHPGPSSEDPLTMLLPVVPVDTPSAPSPTLGPIYGPPLPDEAPPLPDERLGGDGDEAPPATAHPVLVFDAEGGGPGAGLADDGLHRRDGEERTLRIRRAATGAAAVVALGALGAGGWQLASDSSSHAPASAAARTGSPSTVGNGAGGSTGTTAGAGTKPGGATGSSTAATGGAGSAAGRGGRSGGGSGAGSRATGALQPTSTSSSLVAYRGPAGTYTITFSVVGPSDCWLGAQATQGGSYLWMQTVAPGGTTTYTATGPVVIRLGAPPVVSVSVNGRKVALPPGNVQPYDISFTPSGHAA